MTPAIDLAALGTKFRLEAAAINHRHAGRTLAPHHWERRYHYRACERSWLETRDLRARLLALTGHARFVKLWALAQANVVRYRELALASGLRGLQ